MTVSLFLRVHRGPKKTTVRITDNETTLRDGWGGGVYVLENNDVTGFVRVTNARTSMFIMAADQAATLWLDNVFCSFISLVSAEAPEYYTRSRIDRSGATNLRVQTEVFDKTRVST